MFLKKLLIVTILTCGALVALAKGKPGTTKVLIELPMGSMLERELLDQHGAQSLQTYDSFVAVQVPEAALDGLLRALAARQLVAERRPEWDTLLLQRQSIDTREQPPRSSFTYDQGVGLYIVQFDAPLSPEAYERLQRGYLTYVGYLPHNAVLVTGSADRIAALAEYDSVQWTSVYEPAMRAQPTELQDGEHETIVQFANVASTTGHVARFRKSHEILQEVAYEPYVNFRVMLSAEETRELLRDPFVITIEYPGNDVPSGEREAISQSSLRYDNPTSTVYQWFRVGTLFLEPFRNGSANYRDWLPSTVRTNSANYRIAIADTGLDNGGCGDRHPDLYNDMIFTDYSTIGGCAGDRSGHGTMVTGLAVANPGGAPTDSVTRNGVTNTFNFGMGVAPTAKINVQRIIGTNGIAPTPGGQLTWANDAYANECAVQTHSHNEYSTVGGPGAGVYNTTAQVYDQSVRDTYSGDTIDTPMPVFVSAGNICGGHPDYTNGDCTTAVLSPATAKNVISVGAAESYRPGFTTCTTGTRQPGDFYAEGFSHVAYISRRGTSDGRIKPDILAPATMISSTHTQFRNVGHFCQRDASGMYNMDTGTSWAAPQAAAGAVLIDAKYNRRFSPAMLKAALTGTAMSMVNGIDRYRQLNGMSPTAIASRPNSTQGFGRMFLSDILTDAQGYRLLDETSFVPFTASGQTRTGSFTVKDTSRPVVLVLAWSDEPASVPAGVTLVRNLDLDVRSGCTRYTGNRMNSSEYSIAQSSCSGSLVYDTRNNVEMIVIPANTLSTISYVVTAKSWGFGTHNQKFALFAANVW